LTVPRGRIGKGVYFKRVCVVKSPRGGYLKINMIKYKSVSKSVRQVLRRIIHSAVFLVIIFANVDVNGRYIYNHTFVEELRPTLSKVTTNFIKNVESEDLKSLIIILRITSLSQSCLSLTETINQLLVRIFNPDTHTPSSRTSLSMDNPRQIETKMISARGIEYSKPTTRTLKKLDVKVSMDNPGVEFNQRVFPN